MNEKGFATIFGLCLILVIALIVKGIQESEMNHAYETTDFQAEFDLQNAAESGIYMTAEKIKQELLTDKNYLPFNRVNPHSVVNYNYITYRKASQKNWTYTIKRTETDNIKVNVWAERTIINPYTVDYSVTPYIANKTKNENKQKIYWIGYNFFSVAEITDKRTNEKLYRRAFAYVVEKVVTEYKANKETVRDVEDVSADEKNIIHFMNVTAGGYTYKN